MEEYNILEEEKARRHGRTFNRQTATFEKVENYEDEDDCFINFKTEFPAIVFDNTLTAISSEPTVCPPNKNEIDFRISFDKSDNEDYTVIFVTLRPIISVQFDFSESNCQTGHLLWDEGSNNDMPSSPNPTIDDLDFFKEFENEFPSIVYNDARTSKLDHLTKPILTPQHIDEFNVETSLSEYDKENVLYFNDLFNIIHPDDLESEKGNDDNDIDIIQSSEDMAPIPAADQRHPWLRYQIEEYTNGIRHSYEQRIETIWSRPVNRVHILDFEGLTPEMRQDLAVRLRMVYSREGKQVFMRHAWRRLFRIQAPLVCEFILEFLSTCRMSDTEMGLDVANTLCFQLEGGRHLRRHAEERKSGARLSGGHFIGRLTMHFGLVSNEGLRGLQGPKRQQATTAGAHEVDEAGLAVEEVASEIPAPSQAPPPPSPAPHPRTMSQRIERMEDEMHDLQRDVVGLRGVVESFTIKQSRVSTWLITCMTQLMDASGQTYQPFDSTLVGSSRLSF
ncbi:hypothetical protein Tco_1318808 [Tanacetum coccineum]